MKIPAAEAAVKNLPAWDVSNVRDEEGNFRESQAKKTPIHVATLMDLCHMKILELAEHIARYTGRSVLSGDVKHNIGCEAVLTEGASASHVQAVTVLDETSSLPKMAGEAHDAISAFKST